MFIQPNTTVKFIRNCPLDKDYRNSIYFEVQGGNGKQDQYNYFNSLVKPDTYDSYMGQSYSFTLTSQSYQRANKNSIRVAIPCDDLYDCNYMMFQNASYTNKWFYAFIDQINYVNNTTSEVYYTIDVLQTWHFDYGFGDCFIEREHQGRNEIGGGTTTEIIGANILKEPCESGEIIITNSTRINDTPDTEIRVMVLATFDKNFNETYGGVYPNRNDMFSGLNYLIFTLNELPAWLQSVPSNLKEGILTIYMLPDGIYNPNTGVTPSVVGNIPKQYTTLDGYTPRNKKLYTYPYNYLRLRTDSNSIDLRYEFFTEPDYCTIRYTPVLCPVPAIYFEPVKYNTLQTDPTSASYDSIENRVVLQDFPMCPYTADAFKIYLGQNAGSLVAQGLSSIFSLVSGASAGFAVGGPVGAGVGAIKGAGEAISLAGNLVDASRKPNKVIGSQNGMSDYPAFIKNAYVDNMTIRSQFAERVDMFFDKFGYSSLKVKHPNRKVRKYWTYTKTYNCDIHSGDRGNGLPADDIDKIQAIYNNGITWWNYYLPTGQTIDVGNYHTHMGSNSSLWNTLI